MTALSVTQVPVTDAEKLSVQMTAMVTNTPLSVTTAMKITTLAAPAAMHCCMRMTHTTSTATTIARNAKENIDTNTPQGRFVLSIFAALSELEREQTLQRQREGIAIAKSQGKYKGRQPIPIDWDKFGQLYEQWKSGTITAVWFQKEMDLRANTFYRRLKEYKRKIK